MKNREIYLAMFKGSSVWTTFPNPSGELRKCRVEMVGRLESLLRSDSGIEFVTSNRNISMEHPQKMSKRGHIDN